MGKIKIDCDDLMMSLEDHGGFISSYLDKQTGEIIRICDDDDDKEEWYDKLENDMDRYSYIEPMSSNEGYRIMESFVVSLPSSQDKVILEKALSWQKPFSNFKSAIADMGNVRQEWFTFHDKSMRQYIEDFLNADDLEFELV